MEEKNLLLMLKEEGKGLVCDIKKLAKLKTWLYLIRHLSILFFASLLIGVAVYFFLKPAKFAAGGFTGIAILINYVWHKWDEGTLVLLLNIPFLLLGFPLLGRHFVLHSITGIFMLKIGLRCTSILQNMHNYHIKDPWLTVLFGGALLGLGLGITFKTGGNTAGGDLIALINRHFTNMKLGHTLLILDFIVILSSFYILYKQNGSLHNGFYTLAEIPVYSTVIRWILEGFNSSHTITIVSRRAPSMIAQIQKEIGRGVTILNGKGAYTGDRKRVLYIALSPRELPLLQKIVSHEDPQAFMVVQNARDVSGRGFTLETHAVPPGLHPSQETTNPGKFPSTRFRFRKDYHIIHQKCL